MCVLTPFQPAEEREWDVGLAQRLSAGCFSRWDETIFRRLDMMGGLMLISLWIWGFFQEDGGYKMVFRGAARIRIKQKHYIFWRVHRWHQVWQGTSALNLDTSSLWLLLSRAVKGSFFIIKGYWSTWERNCCRSILWGPMFLSRQSSVCCACLSTTGIKTLDFGPAANSDCQQTWKLPSGFIL